MPHRHGRSEGPVRDLRWERSLDRTGGGPTPWELTQTQDLAGPDASGFFLGLKASGGCTLKGFGGRRGLSVLDSALQALWDMAGHGYKTSFEHLLAKNMVSLECM